MDNPLGKRDSDPPNLTEPSLGSGLQNTSGSTLKYRGQKRREIFDRTSVDIHLPSAPPEAFRYASLYWGILLSIMLASVCGMTILMWLRIEDLGVENSATSSIHISYRAGATIQPGTVVSLWNSSAFPGLGVQYGTPFELPGAEQEGRSTIRMASYEDALIVVVLYAPRVMLLHTVTHAGGQWSSPHTEHIMAPSLEAVHDVVMLGPRQAVMLCSVAQAQGTSLKAQLVMWNPDGSLLRTQSFVLATDIASQDRFHTAATRITQGDYVGAVFVWATTTNATCHYSLCVQPPNGEAILATAVSAVQCMSATSQGISATALEQSGNDRVAVVSHMHVITVNVDLSGAALTEGVARLFMSLHPDHATKFRALEYHQQLVIVGSAHTRLAVWLANTLEADIGLVHLRATIDRAQPIGLVDIYAPYPSNRQAAPATEAGVFVVFQETGALLHNVVRLRVEGMGVMHSDVVQSAGPSVGHPQQVAMLTSSKVPVVLFQSSIGHIATVQWTGAFVAVGVATTAAAPGQDVAVQMKGPVGIDQPLIAGLWYYSLPDGTLTPNRYASALPPDRPLGLAVEAQRLHVCLPRLSGSPRNTDC